MRGTPPPSPSACPSFTPCWRKPIGEHHVWLRDLEDDESLVSNDLYEAPWRLLELPPLGVSPLPPSTWPVDLPCIP